MPFEYEHNSICREILVTCISIWLICARKCEGIINQQTPTPCHICTKHKTDSNADIDSVQEWLYCHSFTILNILTYCQYCPNLG